MGKERGIRAFLSDEKKAAKKSPLPAVFLGCVSKRESCKFEWIFIENQVWKPKVQRR